MSKSKIIITAAAVTVCAVSLTAAGIVICKRLYEKKYFTVYGENC